MGMPAAVNYDEGMSIGLQAPRRPRLPAGEREAMVVAGAIRCVAAEGFDLSVRELAERVGVPHSVLFRFFPSKEALLRRLYEEVFVSRLRPEWPALLADAGRPPADRLAAFYRAYTAAIFDETWVRLFLFAGLKGTSLNADYLRVLRVEVLAPVAAALQRGSPAGRATEGSMERAMERAWALHGRIFYLAIRRFVYRRPLHRPLDRVLGDAIAAALHIAADAASPIATSHELDSRPVPAEPAPPRRMSREARSRSIVAGAVVFFARRGIDGQMRELAQHLGIAHSLLFHYFPRKQDLVEEVYRHVFERPWTGDGLRGLDDDATPLRDRLVAFYRAYLAVVDRAEWIRIFISAGLADAGFCGRYLDLVETEVIDVVAAQALRTVGGADTDVAAAVREDVWGLHGEIVYRAIRNHIYAMPAAIAQEETVGMAVECFLASLAIRRAAPASTLNPSGPAPRATTAG